MNKIKIIILILGLLTVPLLCIPLHADGIDFERITIANGLSHNSGLCLLQDKNGFLWIGTQNGLCRYDGYTIKKYFNIPGDSTSLSGNYINSIFEDKSGIIWVGTNQGGLNKFLPASETFTNYKNDPADTFSLGYGSIYSINEDRFGNLWIAVNPSGLFLFDPQTQKFYHFHEGDKNYPGLKGKRAYCLFKDLDNNLWIGTDKGINKLEIKEKKYRKNTVSLVGASLLEKYIYSFINWKNEPQSKNSLVNNNVNAICEENTPGKKIFWIGTEGGLSRMVIDKYGKSTFTNYIFNPHDQHGLSNNLVWSVYCDSKNRLWIGTKKGINEFNLDKEKFERYDFSDDNNKSANYTVRNILEDNSGVIWFGTEDLGLLKLHNPSKSFKVFAHSNEDNHSLSDNNVSSVFEDKNGNLWVGTKYGGLNKLSKKNRTIGKFAHYTHSPAEKSSLLHDHIRGIFQDREGALWIGSWNSLGGLNCMKPGTNYFNHYIHDSENPKSLNDNQVRDIAEDYEGNLWIALTETGLDKLDKQRKYFTHYSNNPFDSNSISDNTVININAADPGFLWLSTFNGGLNKFDLQTEIFTRYKFDSSNKYSISSNRVWTVFIDGSKRIWVGTDKGINFFDRSKEKFISFNESDGLISNSVYGILDDNNGNLWLSTQSGISKMEILSTENGIPEKVKFTNFDSEDNSSITELNSNASFRSKSGELFFGGVKGLVHFFPNKIKGNTNIPNIAITSFKIFEKEAALDSSILLKKRIELSYFDNFFSFEFAALDFQSPKKNNYAYKLEGFNNNWIYSSNRRFVSFSHLDPGEYTFRVKGSNNDGVWNEKGTSLALVITPPFWLTLWFKIISGIFIITIVTFSLRYFFTRKYKRRLHELIVQQKVQDERERISRELHDSIGSNLTSIITGLEISKKISSASGSDDLSENISSLEKHTRDTIDELRQTIWSLQEEVKNIGDLNEKVKEYLLHKIKLNKKPDVKFNFDGSPASPLSTAEALNFFRIIQEAINNAVKYACCSLIEINILGKSGTVFITISDDGKGFDVEKTTFECNGFGISNMRKRAEQVNAGLEICSTTGKGTKVKVIKQYDKPNLNR